MRFLILERTSIKSYRFANFALFIFILDINKSAVGAFKIVLAKRKNMAVQDKMSTECPEIREMATMIVRDYLTGPWKKVTSQNIILQRVSGGLSNWLYQISLPPAYLGQTERHEPETVLLRFHGQVNGESAFEHIITESVIFTLLSERRLGPKLHGIFPGGRIEEFIQARPLETTELTNERVSLRIAEKTAQIHSLQVPISKKEKSMFDVMLKWLSQIEDVAEPYPCQQDLQYLQRFQAFNIRSQVLWLRRYLPTLNSPIMFCHNDLQEGNILLRSDSIDAKSPQLVLIDFEYCSYNYRGFDLANHFLEHTISYGKTEHPYFTIDSKAYPSKESQVQFIRVYLAVYNKLKGVKPGEYLKMITLETDPAELNIPTGDVSEVEEHVLKEVEAFRMASHLFWALWSVLHRHSAIEFGYWEYAMTRLDSYFEVKKELGLLDETADVPGKRKKT